MGGNTNTSLENLICGPQHACPIGCRTINLSTEVFLGGGLVGGLRGILCNNYFKHFQNIFKTRKIHSLLFF